MSAPEATDITLYPIGIDWRKISLDVRNHATYTKECLLNFWELDIANTLNKKDLSTGCPEKFNERFALKYFIMGLNLILMFMSATNNTLIGFKILEQLSLAELSLVAMFLPKDVRILIANSTTFLSNLIAKTKLELCSKRLAVCLKKSKKGLYLEHLALTPFTFNTYIDTLDFTTSNIELIAFNPMFPILTLVTTNNILFVYCYGKKKKHRSILYHESFICPVNTVEWSQNGLMFYIITRDWGYSESQISSYSLNKGTYGIKRHYAIITGKTQALNNSQLWLNNHEIIFVHPHKTENNLSKLTIVDYMQQQTKLLFNLNDFPNLQNVIVSKNKLYFTSDCQMTDSHRHSRIFEFDLMSSKLTQSIHVPGSLVGIRSNNSVLVFLYVAINRLTIQNDTLLKPFINLSESCPYNETYNKQRPLEQQLMIGIFDGTSVEHRKMDSE